MIDIANMEEYLALSRTLNFTRAAEISYITQPAMSRHIAAIEDEVGAKLVKRTSRNVELTAAGEVMADCFEQMVDLYNRSCGEARALSSGKDGHLKIGSPSYWAEDYIEPVIEAIWARDPGFSVETISSHPRNSYDDLRGGAVDIALNGIYPADDSLIRRVVVCREPMCLICLSDSPLASRESVSLSEASCLQGPLVFSAGGGPEVVDAWKKMIMSGIGSCTFKIVPEAEMIGIEIKRTGGFSIGPLGLRHLDRGYLSFVPITDEGQGFDLAFYYRSDNDNPLIPPFINIARETLGRRAAVSER